MSSTKVCRGFVYGSKAHLMEAGEERSDPSHTHKWTIYVRGVDGEDISYFIERVEFRLHESFANPKRTCHAPPFEVTETGWGEFEVPISVYFIDPSENPVLFKHMLQLYHKDGAEITKVVVAEKYDEFVFNTPSVDLAEAFQSHPIESLEKTKINKIFNAELEQKELKMIQSTHERVLAEYELKKLDIARLEEELKSVQAELYDIEQSVATN